MRQNNNNFNMFNQSLSKHLRLVVKIEFSIPVYFSSHADIPNLPAGTLSNTVKKTSSISQSIQPDVGRSSIGSLSFSLLDINGQVTQVLRNNNSIGEGAKGIVVRLYRGGKDMSFFDFRLEQTQRIDSSISYLDNVYDVKCADIQRSLRNEIFDLAKTQLSSNLAAGDEVIAVYTTKGFEPCDHVASFSDRTSGQYIYLKIIKGDQFEIVRATGKTDNSFTGVTRGLFGTLDIEHVIPNGANADNGIKVLEYVYIELPAPAMAYALLTGQIIGGGTIPANWHLGLAANNVNISAFKQLGDDLYNPKDFEQGFIVRFSGVTKTDGKKFIEKEVCLLLGAFMPVQADGRLSIKRMTGVLSDADAAMEFNVDNISSHSKLNFDNSKIHNQISIQWAYLQFPKQKGQFYRQHTLFDANSVNKYGKGKVYKLAFKGLHSSRHTISTIYNRFDALRDRYAGPPILMTIKLLAKMNDVEVGDIVKVNLPAQRDFMAFDRVDRSFEVQKVIVDQLSGQVSVSLFASSESASTIIDVEANQNAELPDDWYIAGINLSTKLNIKSGIVQDNASLNGTKSTRTVFYYANDLTIPNNITLTLFDNIELHVRGHLQIDGKVVVKSARTSNGTIGFIGTTKAGGCFKIPLRGKATELRGKMVTGINDSIPALNIENNKGRIKGIPDNMSGTCGSPGKDAYIYLAELNKYITVNNSAKGGAGGGSLVIVSRGLGFGVNGKIDLSGADGDQARIIDLMDNSNAKNYYFGSGGGGAPGCCVILLDGSAASVPIVTGRITGKFGLCPVKGNSFGTGSAPWHSSDNFCGKSKKERVDISSSIYRIAYVPKTRTPYPVEEELSNTLHPIKSLVFEKSDHDLNQGKLSWNSENSASNHDYRIKLIDATGRYIWVKYADDQNGKNLTNRAAGKSYIGIALYNKTAEKSLEPMDYEWFETTKIDGFLIGNYYVWVKYASSLTGNNISDSPSGKSYIGISIGQKSSTKSLDSEKYHWYSAFASIGLDDATVRIVNEYVTHNTEYFILGLKEGKYRAEVTVFNQVKTTVAVSVLVDIIDKSYVIPRLTLTANTLFFIENKEGLIKPGYILFTVETTSKKELKWSTIPNVRLTDVNGKKSVSATDFADHKQLEVKVSDGEKSSSLVISRLVNGTDAILPRLTRSNYVISAKSDGALVGNLANAGGEFLVFKGITKVTTQCTFAKRDEKGLTATINGSGVYTIDSLTSDQGTVTFIAIFKSKEYLLDYTIIKVKEGAEGLSAYQIWLKEGNTGTEADFIKYLNATDGVNGNTWHAVSSGKPSNSLGVQGDFALSSGRYVYQKTSKTVWTYIKDLLGPRGIQGLSAYQIWLKEGNTGTEADFIKYLDATDGVNGNTWHAVSSGKPSNSLGVQGDFALSSGRYVYKKTSKTVWTYIKDLLGPRGIQGLSAYQIWLKEGNTGTEADFIKYLDATDGVNGNTWHAVSSGKPSNSLGVQGDFALSSGRYVYQKTSKTVWTYIKDLLGPRGIQGPEKYSWSVYSDSKTSGTIYLTNSPYRKYSGVAHNQTSATPNLLSHSRYNWYLSVDVIDLNDKTLFTKKLNAEQIDVSTLKIFEANWGSSVSIYETAKAAGDFRSAYIHVGIPSGAAPKSVGIFIGCTSTNNIGLATSGSILADSLRCGWLNSTNALFLEHVEIGYVGGRPKPNRSSLRVKGKIYINDKEVYHPENPPPAGETDNANHVSYGDGSYSLILGKNKSKDDYLRTTKKGLIPYSPKNSTLGTSYWNFKTVYAINFYENNVLLADKYATKNHNHPKASSTVSGSVRLVWDSSTKTLDIRTD